MALVAVSPERLEARSALARAPAAAGLGGGAEKWAAGFPLRELEGLGPEGRVGVLRREGVGVPGFVSL